MLKSKDMLSLVVFILKTQFSVFLFTDALGFLACQL